MQLKTALCNKVYLSISKVYINVKIHVCFKDYSVHD